MAFLEKIGWHYWIVALVMGIVVPALATAIGISPVMRFGLLLVIINGCVAIILGRLIYRKTQPGWWLLIWPVIYLAGALWFLPGYTRYFAIVYLCVSYLAYGLARTNGETKAP